MYCVYVRSFTELSRAVSFFARFPNMAFRGIIVQQKLTSFAVLLKCERTHRPRMYPDHLVTELTDMAGVHHTKPVSPTSPRPRIDFTCTILTCTANSCQATANPPLSTMAYPDSTSSILPSSPYHHWELSTVPPHPIILFQLSWVGAGPAPDQTACTMSNPPGRKTQLCKRHVLADSGINLIHQRTIAAERFAVLDFHRSLPNARLQSGALDIVHRPPRPIASGH